MVTQLYFQLFDFSKSFNGPMLPYSDQSETTIAKQFFLHFNYFFLYLVWYCLTTCVNRVANCVTQKFSSLRSKFHKSFFWCHFMDNLSNYSTYLSPHYQNSFSKHEFLFSVLGSNVSENICKLRHELKNANNLPELTWSWQNKPLYKI